MKRRGRSRERSRPSRRGRPRRRCCRGHRGLRRGGKRGRGGSCGGRCTARGGICVSFPHELLLSTSRAVSLENETHRGGLSSGGDEGGTYVVEESALRKVDSQLDSSGKKRSKNLFDVRDGLYARYSCRTVDSGSSSEGGRCGRSRTLFSEGKKEGGGEEGKTGARKALAHHV